MTSKDLFDRSKKLMPGGVNSPVRAFKSVSQSPPFIKKAKGSLIYDIEGNSYIDFVGSWGPMILGHANDKVIDAIIRVARDGTSFGAPTLLELEMAELISSIVPSIEMLRMVNSGTEATMSAVRLARGYTKKDKIIKFDGAYHGHGDSFLIKAGSGAVGIPASLGVPFSVAKDTLSAKFNDIASVYALVEQHKDIAAIIVEPVCGNMGCIPPRAGFLASLRSICTAENIVLIFDEVMTGFRLCIGGAQELYNIKPDLTCLGKIVGGGLPVGAYGGSKEIMQHIAPSGDIYQAGTLSGNPLAMAAGIATLSTLKDNKAIYAKLKSLSLLLSDGIKGNLKQLGIKLSLNSVGSMFSLFFTDREVYDADSAQHSDIKKFNLYFSLMLESGIYLAPSQFEAGFVSYAHSKEDIHKTIESNYIALKKIYK